MRRPEQRIAGRRRIHPFDRARKQRRRELMHQFAEALAERSEEFV